MDGRGQHIAVAVSGGGHRATLFAVGSLLYLVDAGKGPELAAVSSVSGGSLANAHLALTCDLTTAEPDQVWREAKAITSQVAGKGTIWAAPLTYAFLGSLGLILAAALWISFLVPAPVVVITWVVALALVGLLAQQRSWIAARSFDRALYHGKTLEDMHASVDHVICSADLQTAEAMYFSARFVHSFRLGWGKPGRLLVARAVQASAALPGAFSVASLPVARHGFVEPLPFTHMKLSDGGVYDNMATEWPVRLARRITEGTPPDPPLHVADELIVVNSSAAQGVVQRRSVRTPVLGEITTLLAVKDVLYDQTTAVRRRLLDLRFRAVRAGFTPPDGDLAGTMVQIDRSPFDIPERFKGDDEIAKRASKALEQLEALGGPNAKQDWERVAKANRDVKTTLSKIDTDRAIALVRHAYVLTMVNAFVLLDYPWHDVPDDASFRALMP